MKSKSWAEHLATLNDPSQFVHSTCCGAFKDYGENQAWVGHGADTVPSLVGVWVDEKKNYHPGEPVQAGVTFGHYSQLVCRDTKEVGCGMATSRDGVLDILVCRYNPPGNVFGQAPY
jgi:hypothetical protein